MIPLQRIERVPEVQLEESLARAESEHGASSRVDRSYRPSRPPESELMGTESLHDMILAVAAHELGRDSPKG